MSHDDLYWMVRRRARRSPAWLLRRRDRQITSNPRPSTTELVELSAIRRELNIRSGRRGPA